MARYLTLINFTDQGAKHVDESVDRATQFGKMVSAAGGKLLFQYWSMGEYDGCVAFEVDDGTSAAALLVKLAKDGNVRTQTQRLYDNQEFQEIARQA